jgi:hypothetical protein
VHLRREGVNLGRQRHELRREIQPLLILPLLVLDHFPLVVGQDLPFHVGAVLADHHERAQEVASKDTIIVSRPYGNTSSNGSTLNHRTNQITWR